MAIALPIPLDAPVTRHTLSLGGAAAAVTLLRSPSLLRLHCRKPDCSAQTYITLHHIHTDYARPGDPPIGGKETETRLPRVEIDLLVITAAAVTTEYAIMRV